MLIMYSSRFEMSVTQVQEMIPAKLFHNLAFQIDRTQNTADKSSPTH